jgi:hypothetical protein
LSALKIHGICRSVEASTSPVSSRSIGRGMQVLS